MTNQTVSRFRVKKLSPKHPLPVFKESQLPDLTEAASLQRSVPQIETGVEKEEEEEHDLQAAISAAQAAVTTGAKVESYIPTPDASRVIPDEEYYALYKKKYKEPSTLIRFSSTVEDVTGCPYMMDEQDDEFLQRYNADKSNEPLTPDAFEEIMWQFESVTNHQLPHLNLDPSHIPEYADFMTMIPDNSKLRGRPSLENVYQHWRQRRFKRQGKSVVPELKSEDTLRSEIDPYVCFRRRETKPVRKTRRTDQQSLDRLRKLRTEMEMSRNLLEMVLRREKIRKEGLVLEHTVFDKKCKLREYQRALGIKEDEDLLPIQKKKRKTSLEIVSSGATIKIPLNKLKRDGIDGRQEKTPMQIALEAELSRKREQDAPYEDLTECPYQPFPLPIPQQFYRSLPSRGPTFRRRVGRGGRIFLDRTGCKRKTSHSVGGKTKPGFQQELYDPYWFESDSSDDEFKVDEMQDSFLRHRVQLLTEVELRSLVTIPFLNPLSIMNIHAANMRANQAAAAAAAAAAAQRAAFMANGYILV
ncbi:enhancer of polycomb-like-domain-containing protein [Phycomyces nitens]|nr:enhancer of polycomb-like-domain-containing protein [Phycomyces nitens]